MTGVDKLIVGCCSCQREECEFCGGFYIGDPEPARIPDGWLEWLNNQRAAKHEPYELLDNGF